MGNDVLAVTTYTGLHDEHGHNAIDALHELKEDDHHPAGPAQDLHSAHTAAVPQNLATTLDDHKDPNDHTLDAPVFVIGGDHEEDYTKDVEMDPASAETEPNAAQLRRDRQSTVEDVINTYLIAKPSGEREKASSSTYAPSARSLQSIPFEADPVADSAESPLLRKHSTPPAPVGDRPGGVNAEFPMVSGSKPSPEGYQKPSTISRAVSMLSEISARSGLQTSSLRSIKQNKRNASANLTARPYYHYKRAVQNSGHQRAGRSLAEKWYRPLRHEPRSKRLQGTESTNGTILLRQQENQSESFTKVITGLESLMREALTISGARY